MIICNFAQNLRNDSRLFDEKVSTQQVIYDYSVIIRIQLTIGY